MKKRITLIIEGKETMTLASIEAEKIWLGLMEKVQTHKIKQLVTETVHSEAHKKIGRGYERLAKKIQEKILKAYK